MIGKVMYLQKYCKDLEKIENYKEALESSELYVCHHRLEFTPFSGKSVSWRYLESQGMYWDVQPEALIFMKNSEHKRLHACNIREETRKKISEKSRGQPRSPELRARISNTLKGHPVSKETVAKIQATRKANGDISTQKARDAAARYHEYRQNGGTKTWLVWRHEDAKKEH